MKQQINALSDKLLEFYKHDLLFLLCHLISTAYRNKSLKLGHWALNMRKYVLYAHTFYL